MKVLISGYYGFGNAGDELILESIISDLRSRSKDININVLSFNPLKTAKDYNVDSVNRWNFFHILKAVFKTDILISGGGGLFQDNTGIFSLYYYLAIILAAKFFRKKIFVYSAGINELNKINKKLTAYVLGFADKITLRESASALLLEKWGCNSAKIEITADPVLIKKIPLEITKKNDSRLKILFVIRPSLKEKRQAEKIADIADSLSEKLNADIEFMPFHISADLKFITAVSQKMKCISKIILWNNFNDIYNSFQQADFVISQRFHALVLASLFNKPLAGISDDAKLERFLQELKQPCIKNLSLMDNNTVLDKIIKIWDTREEFKKNIDNILPFMKTRAQKASDIFFQLYNQK